VPSKDGGPAKDFGAKPDLRFHGTDGEVCMAAPRALLNDSIPRCRPIRDPFPPSASLLYRQTSGDFDGLGTPAQLEPVSYCSFRMSPPLNSP